MLRIPYVQINTVGRQRVPLPIECYRIQIWPNNHRNHSSYGDIMRLQWAHFPDAKGMVWLEGDVAIAPEHIQELTDDIECYPDFVITVPYLLYPKTTQRDEPIWSVQSRAPLGGSVPIPSRIPPPREPGYFSLGCTYLPRKLLDACQWHRGNWDYPCLDTRLSETAHDRGIICMATDTPALHLHY